MNETGSKSDMCNVTQRRETRNVARNRKVSVGSQMIEEYYPVVRDNQIMWVSVVWSGRRHQMTQLTAPTLVKHHGPGLPVPLPPSKATQEQADTLPSQTAEKPACTQQTANDPMAEPRQDAAAAAAAEPRLPRVTIQFCTQCKLVNPIKNT